jgi:trehalose/maltose transport system substrate-binding protein
MELLREAIDEWVKKNDGKHTVEVVILPHASNECFALYRQWFSAKSFDVDILVVDIAWIECFSEYFADLTEYFNPNEMDEDDFFEVFWKSMHSGERLVALPMYADCGVIFYRTDLLAKYSKPIPITWEELYETAEYIQKEERKKREKRNKFYGFVFQAKAFEILTCNFTELIDSFGGAIITDGMATIDSEKGVDAIMLWLSCLQNISSKSVLNYSEEDARGMFQSGNAVFMRNWPYAWSLLNSPLSSVAGNVGVFQIPPSAKGGKSSGVLGGWFLVVSEFSKHKRLATDLVRFLTSKEQQKKRSGSSYLPTYKSLYADPNVLGNNPHFAYVYDALRNAVIRPAKDFGINYPRASTEIFNAINSILAELSPMVENPRQIRAEVKKLLGRLNKKLNSLLHKTKVEDKDGLLTKICKSIKKFLGIDDEKIDEID